MKERRQKSKMEKREGQMGERDIFKVGTALCLSFPDKPGDCSNGEALGHRTASSLSLSSYLDFSKIPVHLDFIFSATKQSSSLFLFLSLKTGTQEKEISVLVRETRIHDFLQSLSQFSSVSGEFELR